MKVVLISTYDLGRQPFGLASPAAWLRDAGHEVTCADLAVGSMPTLAVREAELIAFHLPMHTATRLAAQSLPQVRRLNNDAHLCAYGLYAPLNQEYLRRLGVQTILGGEFESALTRLASGATVDGKVLDRLNFLVPDRSDLPVLSRYPKLIDGRARKKTGYTEASRGCKHLCRHCPVVPVYEGKFRIVQSEVVVEDVRRQVAAGAEHITFGDPDFFNGPTHARRIIEAMHAEFPQLTYDVTIKIEHLLRHRDLLSVLKATGCLFITSAVESLDDQVLEKLAKGHTRSDFIQAADLLRAEGLTLSPTFIPFTPWTTRESYRELLEMLLRLELVANVGSVQLGLRLLVTSNSRLLELEGIRNVCGEFDAASLCYPWRHRDAAVDRLTSDVMRTIQRAQGPRKSRQEIFAEVWSLVNKHPPVLADRATIPYLEEPWYC